MLTFNRHHKPDAIESLIYDNRDIEFSIGWSDQLYSIQVTGVTHLINGNRVQLTFVVNSMFGDTVLKLVRRICMELPIIVRRENDRLSADRLKCVGREYPGAG